MTALRSVLVIARITLLEALRNRILLVALAFAVALVGISVAAAAVSMGERARLIVDVGLAAASAMGSLIAIALTIATFAHEIAQHTAYPVLARPLPRWAFVLGKYFGVLATMVAVVTLMLLATALAVWLYGDALPHAFWPSIWLAWLEMALVIAISLLFSCYTTPVLAATYSVALLIAGNLAADLLALAERLIEKGYAVGRVVDAAYYVLPDLESLSLRTQAANNLAAPPAFIGWATLYALSYSAVALGLAMLLFTRRRAI
jgi:ABC-type transport system involved in multi-copper enzyme maturation permease subunit